MAWVVERYAQVAYALLYRAQDVAQDARIAPWRDAEPVPPWEWRKAKKERAAERT